MIRTRKVKKLQEIEEKKRKREAKTKKVAENQAALKKQELEKKEKKLKDCWELFRGGGHSIIMDFPLCCRFRKQSSIEFPSRKEPAFDNSLHQVSYTQRKPKSLYASTAQYSVSLWSILIPSGVVHG